MKLGEVVIPNTHVYHNFTKFHQIRMKNKKGLFIDRLTEVLSVKVPLRLGEFGLFEISNYPNWYESDSLLSDCICIPDVLISAPPLVEDFLV